MVELVVNQLSFINHADLGLSHLPPTTTTMNNQPDGNVPRRSVLECSVRIIVVVRRSLGLQWARSIPLIIGCGRDKMSLVSDKAINDGIALSSISAGAGAATARGT